MVNKMNKSMKPETSEERRIENILKQARASKELVDFAEELKEDLEGIEIPFYSYRVKKLFSAIRTFRLAKHKKAEDLQDLFGILVVVENEQDISRVVQKIKERLEGEYEEYDLLTEKSWIEQKAEIEESKFKSKEGHQEILEVLKRAFSNTENLEKVLPPFSYIITSHISMGDKTIPIEFRIHTKAGFQIIESGYFTVYKNDEIDPKEKAPLIYVVQQLMNRKIKLDREELSEEEEKQLIREMGELYQYDFNILCQNRDIILEVWKEFAKISAKYELQLPVHDFHFFGEKEMTLEEIEIIDNDLDKAFESYKSFDLRDIDTKSYIENTIHNMQVGSMV